MTASLDHPAGLDEPGSAVLDQSAAPGADQQAAQAAPPFRPVPAEAGYLDSVPGFHGEVISFLPAGPPAPAWLVRQPVRRARRTKAILALTAMAAAAIALGWTVVMLALKGMAVEPAGVTTAPAARLIYPAPGTAGGLPRHSAVVGNRGTRAVIAQFRQRFAAILNGSPASYPAALYNEPGRVDLVTGTPAWLMYLGFNEHLSLTDPAATVSRLMASVAGPHGNVRPWQVIPGPAGGIAKCVVAIVARTQVAICGWATSDTIGAVLSPTRDTTVSELAVLISRMRPDLQPG